MKKLKKIITNQELYNKCIVCIEAETSTYYQNYWYGDLTITFESDFIIQDVFENTNSAKEFLDQYEYLKANDYQKTYSGEHSYNYPEYGFKLEIALPDHIEAILDSFDENTDAYQECRRIEGELNEVGYSCDYDLSGEIYTVWEQ